MNKIRRLALFICTLTLSLALSVVMAMAAPVEADNYNLVINGTEVLFDAESAPIINDGSTLLPLRFLVSVIDKDNVTEIGWDTASNQITLNNGVTEVKLWIDSDSVEVNGAATQIDTAPVIYKDKTYVPLRFLANVFDMTVSWNAQNRTAYAIDNKMLDRIMELMENSNNLANDTKIYAEIMMAMNMTMNVGGESETFDMIMEGAIRQDYANRFQHLVMNTSVMGESIIVETYDDGEAMYMIMDGQAMKMESAFSMADNILAQYNIISSLNMNRELYTPFNLEEDDNNLILSGVIYLPDEYFDDIFSKLEGMEEIMSLMSEAEVSVSPIYCRMVMEKTTGTMISMDMDFSFDMAMNVQGMDISAIVDMNMQIPKFETNAQFDSIVPADIAENAAEM